VRRAAEDGLRKLTPRCGSQGRAAATKLLGADRVVAEVGSRAGGQSEAGHQREVDDRVDTTVAVVNMMEEFHRRSHVGEAARRRG